MKRMKIKRHLGLLFVSIVKNNLTFQLNERN